MIKEKQKGVSIYLVIVMVSVLLAAALGLASIIIGGSRIAENLTYSVKAFHAADTGIEKALYNIKITSGTCDNSTSDGSFGTDYNYDVTMSTTGTNCADTGTSITSLGRYKTVVRKIEASFGDNPVSVDGACGTKDGQYSSSAPTGQEACLTGTIDGMTGSYSWTCKGLNGGTDSATCSTVAASYTVVQFTTTGTHTWTVPAGVTSVDYLVVGGGGNGGSGSSDGSGGGGAGGYYTGTGLAVSGTETIVVGGAGSSSSLTNDGTTIVASAGVSAVSTSAGASGNGHAGGSSSSYAGGGGGGVTAVGGAASASKGGDGGAGTTVTIGGTSISFGGGGGGGSYDYQAGAGGFGGGGAGSYIGDGTSATPNTGGGGGGSNGGGAVGGGAGGSGIVVIGYINN